MAITVGNSNFISDKGWCKFFLAQNGKCRVGDWRFK
jgi:hypothetical protein